MERQGALLLGAWQEPNDNICLALTGSQVSPALPRDRRDQSARHYFHITEKPPTALWAPSLFSL